MAAFERRGGNRRFDVTGTATFLGGQPVIDDGRQAAAGDGGLHFRTLA